MGSAGPGPSGSRLHLPSAATLGLGSRARVDGRHVYSFLWLRKPQGCQEGMPFWGRPSGFSDVDNQGKPLLTLGVSLLIT